MYVHSFQHRNRIAEKMAIMFIFWGGKWYFRILGSMTTWPQAHFKVQIDVLDCLTWKPTFAHGNVICNYRTNKSRERSANVFPQFICEPFVLADILLQGRIVIFEFSELSSV